MQDNDVITFHIKTGNNPMKQKEEGAELTDEILPGTLP